MFGDHLLEPYILPERLNSSNYLVSYSTSSRVCWKKYWLLCARTCGSGRIVHKYIFRLQWDNYLDAKYSGRCIGRVGLVAWPPWSPDNHPLNFFFLDHMKSLVYQTPVDTLEDLTARMIVGCAMVSLVSAVQWPLRPQIRTIPIKISHLFEMKLWCIVCVVILFYVKQYFFHVLLALVFHLTLRHS